MIRLILHLILTILHSSLDSSFFYTHGLLIKKCLIIFFHFVLFLFLCMFDRIYSRISLSLLEQIYRGVFFLFNP